MYKISSKTELITRFSVTSNGKRKTVSLKPKNYVLADELTDQIKNLEFNSVVKITKLPDKIKNQKQNQNQVVEQKLNLNQPTTKVTNKNKATTEIKDNKEVKA